MAAVDLSRIQFWQPPLASSSFEQRTTLQHIHKNDITISETISRIQPVSLDTADEVLGHDSQAKYAIVRARNQRRDSAPQHKDNVVGAQDRNYGNSDDEVDNDLLSIKEIISQTSHKILTEGYRNSQHYLQYPIQYLEEPVFDRSGSCPSPEQPIPDDGVGDSLNRPVVLDDDEPVIRSYEAAAVSALVNGGAGGSTSKLQKPLGSSTYKAWDVEDGCFLDNDLCPFSPLHQEASISIITLAQDQPNLHNRSASSSQDRIGQNGHNGTIRSTSEEPITYSPPLSLDKENRVKENANKFEMNLNTASEHRELPPATPDSLNPNPLPLSLIDLEHNQSRTISSRSEKLKYSNPFQSPDYSKDQPQKRQQGQVLGGAMREDGDNGGSVQGGCDKKRQNRNRAEETVEIQHSEDDENPRTAKRQKLCEILTLPESYTSQTLRSPSTATASLPIAEYQEWPFQGFLKRTIIGKETIYNLEFKMPDIPEYPDIPIDPELLRSGTETAEGPPETILYSTIHPAAFYPQKMRSPWYPEEDATILNMKKNGHSWENIHAALPSHSKGSIQVRYSTRLKPWH